MLLWWRADKQATSSELHGVMQQHLHRCHRPQRSFNRLLLSPHLSFTASSKAVRCLVRRFQGHSDPLGFGLGLQPHDGRLTDRNGNDWHRVCSSLLGRLTLLLLCRLIAARILGRVCSTAFQWGIKYLIVLYSRDTGLICNINNNNITFIVTNISHWCLFSHIQMGVWVQMNLTVPVSGGVGTTTTAWPSSSAVGPSSAPFSTSPFTSSSVASSSLVLSVFSSASSCSTTSEGSTMQGVVDFRRLDIVKPVPIYFYSV